MVNNITRMVNSHSISIYELGIQVFYTCKTNMKEMKWRGMGGSWSQGFEGLEVQT